jgi:universal stress protein E
MSKSDSVLIVIDPTADKQPALERGVDLARHRGMRVEMFICDYRPQVVGATFLDSSKLKRAKEQIVNDHLGFLENLAKKYIDEGLEVGIKAAWDRPLYEGIIRQALESDARFVIKDTHYHSGISRALFTNTDWHLIQSCAAPLWLAKPEAALDRPTIIAAVDPLHEHDQTAALDARILSEAFELAAQLEGVVEVFHAFNPFESPDDPERAEKTHAEALTSLTERFQVEPERVHLLAGSVTDVLPHFAGDRAAALVVMGAVSRSRIEHAIIGSTAENVLDRLPCDVLVIKPKGYISPVTFKSRPTGYYYADWK